MTVVTYHRRREGHVIFQILEVNIPAKLAIALGELVVLPKNDVASQTIYLSSIYSTVRVKYVVLNCAVNCARN